VAPLLLGILTTSVVVGQTPSSAISHFKVGIKENKKHNFDRAIEEFTIAIEISSHLVNIVPERGFAPCLWRVKPNWIQLRKERP